MAAGSIAPRSSAPTAEEQPPARRACRVWRGARGWLVPRAMSLRCVAPTHGRANTRALHTARRGIGVSCGVARGRLRASTALSNAIPFSNGPHVRGRPPISVPCLLPLARGAFPAGLAAEHGRTPVAGCGAGSVPGRARIGCELAGALVSPAARRLLRRRWRLRVSWDLCARPRARSAGPSACCRGSGIGGCQRGVPAERAAATYAGL